MQAKVVVFLFLLSAGSIYAQQKMMPKYQVYKQKRREACFQKYGPCGPLYSHLFEDIIRINLDLLTWDSYKILVSIFPFYLAARMLDDDIHANFYCYVHHKNKNQFPDWCNKGAQYGLSIPLIALGSLAFLGRDDEMRLLGWSIILGLPFLVFGNKVTKKIQFDGCYRPWHESFSNVKRSGGGFPSGHMSKVTYMTALVWMRYGPKWAFPLGVYGLLVGVNFCVSNRHYASQLVAGVGWGLMYAFAANKFIDDKIAQRIECKMMLDFQGQPAVRFAYSW